MVKEILKKSTIEAQGQVQAQEPKRGRGRPKGSKTKIKPQQTEGQAPIYNNIVDINSDDYKSAINLKGELNLKEIEFLQLYLTGRHTIKQSMKLAGYNGYNEKYLYRLSRQIVQKFESQSEDHRIIARALGAGEVFVIKGLMDLAKDGNSEIVKRAALADLAKILGLTKEQLEGAGGVTIIFEGSGAQVPGPGAPPPPSTPPPGTPVALPISTKPIMITK